VTWTVENHDEFDQEFDGLPEEVQDRILAIRLLLQKFGPHLGRPHADTLVGSKHANMKELRFEGADGVWRVAFALDPRRSAILLVAGDKSGRSEKKFYKKLIAKADKRYDRHVAALKEAKNGKKSR
jgi:hypothetical protein